MENNINSSEEYKQKYNATKVEVLLPEDISLMKQITDEVNKFPTLVSSDELVDMESRLVALSFKLAGLIGRLTSQYEIRAKELELAIVRRANEIIKEGLEKTKVRALEIAEEELFEKKTNKYIFSGIVDEYKGKAFVLKDVFLAITHRIHKFNKGV